MTFSFTKMFGFDGAIPASLTTLEKRFSMSSKQAGFLFSVYDAAFMVIVIPFVRVSKNRFKKRIITFVSIKTPLVKFCKIMWFWVTKSFRQNSDGFSRIFGKKTKNRHSKFDI